MGNDVLESSASGASKRSRVRVRHCDWLPLRVCGRTLVVRDRKSVIQDIDERGPTRVDDKAHTRIRSDTCGDVASRVRIARECDRVRSREIQDGRVEGRDGREGHADLSREGQVRVSRGGADPQRLARQDIAAHDVDARTGATRGASAAWGAPALCNLAGEQGGTGERRGR